MDPCKQIGKIKEQVAMEHQARRNFAKKWTKLSDPELNNFYNPNEINKQLRGLLTTRELCPFVCTGHGDSYFVSPEMYRSLVAQCRCGRRRSEAHMLKCLQRARDECLTGNDVSGAENQHAQPPAKGEADTKTQVTGRNAKTNKLPETTNAFVGWQRHQPVYKQWEATMKHVSPVHTMPGPRITATPYNVLFIG